MSNIKINLSEFKHLKSDDKSTTLQHKQGHTITLAHNALSKPNQEALKALAQAPKDAATPEQSAESKTDKLAKGGAATTPARMSQIQTDNTAKGIDLANKLKFINPDGSVIVKKEDEQKRKPNSLPDYGKVVKKAEGGKIPKFCAYCGGAAHEGECSGGEVQRFEDGGVTQPEPDMVHKIMGAMDEATQEHLDEGDQAAIEKGLDLSNPSTRANMQAHAADTTAAAPASTAQPTADQTPLPGLADAMPSADAQQSNKAPAPVKDDDFGLSQGLRGIGEQATASTKMAKAAEPVMEERVKGAKSATAAFQANLQDLRKERLAHIADIQHGYIDPEKYWTGDAQGNGSHSRLAAGLGMILAGFNPAGTPNAAIDFINRQMDRNLEAQRTNLESKQNLYRLNLEQFRNEKDAADMTRLMQNDALQHQLDMLKNKYTSQFAQAEADKLKGALRMQAAPLEMQMAMRRTAMNLSGMPAATPEEDISRHAQMAQMYRMMGNNEMAKSIEDKIVPGVGVSTSNGVSDAQRAELRSHANLQSLGNDLLNYSKTHTNVVPGTAEYNYGVTKALAFQQAVREGLLGTVFRETEKPLLEKFVKENPANAFKAFNTQPQLKSILDSNALEFQTKKHAAGIKDYAPPQQAQPSQEPIKSKDGRMYIRKGNFMVPVNQ